MPLSPQDLAAKVQGLLSFPVTPFDAAGEVDLPRFASTSATWRGRTRPGLFVCGGTGEFYSLVWTSIARWLRAAVEGSVVGCRSSRGSATARGWRPTSRGRPRRPAPMA